MSTATTIAQNELQRVRREVVTLVSVFRGAHHAPPLSVTKDHVCTAKTCGATFVCKRTSDNVPVYLCPKGFKAHVCGKYCSKTIATDGFVTCTLTGVVVCREVVVSEVPYGAKIDEHTIHRYDRANRGMRLSKHTKAARTSSPSPPPVSSANLGSGNDGIGSGNGWSTSRTAKQRKKRSRTVATAATTATTTTTTRLVRPPHRHRFVARSTDAAQAFHAMRIANRLIVRLLVGRDRTAVTLKMIAKREAVACALARSKVAKQRRLGQPINAIAVYRECMAALCKGLTFSASVADVRQYAKDICRQVVCMWIALRSSAVAARAIGVRGANALLQVEEFNDFCVFMLYQWTEGVATDAVVVQGASGVTPPPGTPQFLLYPNTFLRRHLPPLMEVHSYIHASSDAYLSMRKNLHTICALLSPRAIVSAFEQLNVFQEQCKGATKARDAQERRVALASAKCGW